MNIKELKRLDCTLDNGVHYYNGNVFVGFDGCEDIYYSHDPRATIDELIASAAIAKAGGAA